MGTCTWLKYGQEGLSLSLMRKSRTDFRCGMPAAQRGVKYSNVESEAVI